MNKIKLVSLLIFTLFYAKNAFASITPPAVKISAGANHNMAVMNDATLWGWGDNSYGQLGDGTTSGKAEPVQIGTGWQTVESGETHTVGIKTDSTLWAWGNNNYGQLGDGTVTDKGTPVQVGISADWISVSAGAQHTLAIKTDGTLWAWGNNDYGQLGDGTIINKNTPVQVGNSADWVSVSAGVQHSLAIKTDGTLWAWGNNDYGQLGDGTIINKNTPAQVGSGADWASVSAGAQHTLAIKTNGTLWGWGNSVKTVDMQTPAGTILPQFVIVPVQLGTDWLSVDTSYLHTAGIKKDGTIWTWGYNGFGQLGDGTTTDRYLPVQVGINSLQAALQVTAGYSHTTAIKTDNTIWSWGANLDGNNGNIVSSQITSINTPWVSLSKNLLNFTARSGKNPSDQVLNISNAGSGTLVWSVSDDASWLSPVSGVDAGSVVLSVDVTGLGPGSYNGTITVSGADSSQTASVSLKIAEPIKPLVITTASLPNASIEQEYNAQLSASGGTSPYRWLLVSGALPAGISLNAGTISGTASYGGVYSFWVQVKDRNSFVAYKWLVINIILPDLTISYLTPSAVVITSGQSVSVTDTTNNQGLDASEESTTAYYLSNDTTWDVEDIYIGDRTVPPVAIGSSSTGGSSMIVTAQAGSYYIIAIADANSAITESDDTNNINIAAITIKAKDIDIKKPDLILSLLTVPNSINRGKSVAINDTTKNQGNTNAKKSVTKYYLSKNDILDKTDKLLGKRSVAALFQGKINKGKKSVLIPKKTIRGKYYIIAFSDSDKAVAESDEVNNISIVPIFVK